MHGRKALNRHAALMNKMAQTLGVNLTEMMFQGKLAGDEWREAVVRCVGCTDPTECLHWLSAQAPDTGRTGASDTAPDYCANREMMARLRDKLGETHLLAEAAEGGK